MKGGDKVASRLRAGCAPEDRRVSQVLQVQRPHRRRPWTSLTKEAFFIQQLAAYPDIVVPHVLGYGRHDNIEYISEDPDAGRPRAHGRTHRGAKAGRVASAREDPAAHPREAPGAFLKCAERRSRSNG